MSHHIVEAQDLHFTYPDGTEVLRGISFRITHGESVAIVGANGAGKSTLLLHLNGYLTSTKGVLRIGDSPLVKENLKQVRRAVGLVFQDPDDQLFMPTVFDDVAFGPLNMGLPAAEVQTRVKAALQTVGAWHLHNRPPYRLSAGEKRAVAIATVLSMSPDLRDSHTQRSSPHTTWTWSWIFAVEPSSFVRERSSPTARRRRSCLTMNFWPRATWKNRSGCRTVPSAKTTRHMTPEQSGTKKTTTPPFRMPSDR
jgi:ABC-type ATPase involved in cell division